MVSDVNLHRYIKDVIVSIVGKGSGLGVMYATKKVLDIGKFHHDVGLPESVTLIRASGIRIFTFFNLVENDNFIAMSLGLLMKGLKGSGPSPDGTGLQHFFYETIDDGYMKDFSLAIPIGDVEISFEHTFAAPKPVFLDKQRSVALKALSLAFSLNMAPPSVEFMFEVVAEFKMPKTYDWQPDTWAIGMCAVSVGIGATGVDLALAVMMKLKTQNQVWANPFGVLPNMGIIFPIGLGFAFTITYVPPFFVPNGLEFEFGFVACASPVRFVGTEEDAAAAATLDDLSRLYACAEDDIIQGPRPMVLKAAAIVSIEQVSFGFYFYAANFSPFKLVLYLLPFKPPSLLSLAKPVIDGFYAEKIEVSFNPMPYPLELMSGTQIAGGILVDLVNVNLWNFIHIDRFYVRFSMLDEFPHILIEAQVYIQPFEFEAAGRFVVQVKHHLHDWRIRRTARRLQNFQQFFKRQVLVIVSAERACLYPRQHPHAGA